MANKYKGKFPSAWTDAEVKAYKATGKEPPITRNGLWVTDKDREDRPLREWTTAELFALASGELFSFKTTGTDEFYGAVRGRAKAEHKNVEHWGEGDLDHWLLTGEEPSLSPNGYFINDPTRWTKEAATWNSTELTDLGAGHFGELERSHMYILDEAADRFGLPMGITWEDYKHYIETGERPVMTSNDILINDRNRAAKDPVYWDEKELHAWLNGEIKTTESKEKDLLVVAINHFGAGRYWTKEQLAEMVVNEGYPDIDYTQYTEEQLETLAETDNDKEAQHLLLLRHPANQPPEPTVEMIHENVAVERDPLDEAVPEDADPAPQDDPSVEGSLDTPGEDGPVCDGESGGDCGPAQEEQATEDPAEMHWTDLVPEGTAVYDALFTGTSDVVINDTERRKNLSASNWTLNELVAWVRGDIAGGNNTTDKTLLSALRIALGSFCSTWVDEDVKAFVSAGDVPEGLAVGLLKRDRVRDQKHPGDWTDDEIKAWGSGKVESTQDAARILMVARNRYKLPDRLNDEEVKEYLMSGKIAMDETPPIEPGKVISKRQLDEWLQGKLVAPEGETERLFAKARSEYTVDVHWTDDQLLSFIRNGIKPKRLPDGTRVDDRMRNLDEFKAWSWNELKALDAGQVVANFTINDALVRVRHLIDIQFGAASATWSDDEVLVYLRTKTKPKALESGVFITDPTRVNKIAYEWRSAELKAWLAGEIFATEKAPEDDLWDEVYRRFEISLFAYRQDAKALVLNGKVIPRTPSGLYVRDRYRDSRPPSRWTRREVKAWCRGLILPAILSTPDSMIKRAATLFGVSLQLSDADIKKRISDISKESTTMTVNFVINDMTAYVAGRAATADSGTATAPYQTMLDRCINRVLRLEGEDFVQGWTELLKFFYENSKGCLSWKNVYIGVGSMVITPKGLRNFNNMTALLINTADPKTRDTSLKSIEWNAVLANITNETTRQNILAYYGKS